MPEIVISNTTPIITLIGLNQLHLLKEIYGQIVVPKAVLDELEAGKDKELYTDIHSLAWVRVLEVRDSSIVKYLMNDLDRGEAEVIALAEELGAQRLIIDEKVGRNYAKLRGFTCVGTLGVLVKAKQQGLLTSIKPLLRTMQQNGIWINESLIKQILSITNESE